MLGTYYKLCCMQNLHNPLIIGLNREYDDRAALRRLSSTVLLPFATANYKGIWSCTIVKLIVYLYRELEYEI